MTEQPEPRPSPSSEEASEKAKAEALQKIVTQKAPDIINAVPAEKRPRLFQIVQESISVRSGPLPDPADLAAYNSVIPNGADRIMKMAEAQSAHRMELEKLVVRSQQRQGTRGQICALIIGVTGLGLATYAALSGQPVFGGVIGGSTLVALVSGFLVSRQRQTVEVSVKQQQVMPQQHGKRKKR